MSFITVLILPLSSSVWSSVPPTSVTMLEVLSVILAMPSAINLNEFCAFGMVAVFNQNT
jgi:hypothetical protein